MSNLDELKRIAEEIIKGITEEHDNLNIEISESTYTIIMKAFVPQSEKGRVIGRKASMINAIRVVLQGVVSKEQKKKLIFEINDERE